MSDLKRAKIRLGEFKAVYSIAQSNIYHVYDNRYKIKRGSRGGGGVGPDPPPPLRFIRGGVLCGYLMGSRGGPKVVFLLFS